MKYKLLSCALIVAQLFVYLNIKETREFLLVVSGASVLYSCFIFLVYAGVSLLLSLSALFLKKEKRNKFLLISTVSTLIIFFGYIYIFVDPTFIRTLPVFIPECCCLLILSYSLYKERGNNLKE